MDFSQVPPLITDDLARRALVQAVEQYGPEYVDLNATSGNECANLFTMYFDPDEGVDVTLDTPHRCIFAQAMHNLGVPDDAMTEGSAHSDLLTLHELHNIQVTALAYRRLLGAQQTQDHGHPWGQCIDTPSKEETPSWVVTDG